jgi:DNA-binding transcriptional ArsR family regulator
MSEQHPARRRATRLTDPKALRALAHPIRLQLMGLLRTEGPLTATKAGELIGESSASTSFHLRQLAKYGLVEPAEGGQGRERPWRASEQFTDLPSVIDEPKLEAAAGVLNSVIAEYYFESLMRWLEVRPDEPAQWQRADLFGDTMVYVTASELDELGRQVRALVDQYIERTTDPAKRPPDARLVSFLHIAHPEAGPRQQGSGDQPETSR